MPRDRGQDVQEKVMAMQDRPRRGLPKTEYPRLKDRLTEQELIDELTSVVHFVKVDQGDIRCIKKILGEHAFCEIYTYDAKDLRVSFTNILS